MTPEHPDLVEPRLRTRSTSPEPLRTKPRRLGSFARYSLLGLAAVLILLAVAVFAGRWWLRSITRDSLPQLSGTIVTPGLAAPVTITRDPRGIPSLHARTFDDLLFAQGFVTAQDRLFQMDTLRRHAAGELAEILGPGLVPHDRLQRTLALGPAADRILTELPPDQLHAFERYAAGVNAAIAVQSSHPPLEFHVLAYDPRPWTARDCVLVSLVLFEDLTNNFPTKLNREALTARLAPTATAAQRAELLADLYPVGSWRDHPPSQPATDLTTPLETFPDIPLDDSQVRLHSPSATPADLLALSRLTAPSCPDCRVGSNNFAVSGAHTASGKPLLANDMHLSLAAPGIWYANNLESDVGPVAAQAFHVAGVSLPGVPYVVVGHNDHVAWGFTNLGADVQDLYIEHLNAAGPSTTFQTPDGHWQPVTHRQETIRVRGGHNLTLDLVSTAHGGVATPLINPILPSEPRSIALRWSLFDTARFSLPFAAFNAAGSVSDLLEAARTYTGPAQNLLTADDAGHIAFHAIGRIPLRGPILLPSPLSPVPTDATGPDAAAHEWSSTIPFDQLPATLDPPGGVLATANARITPDAYPFPITLNWADPYRNERIWRLLAGRNGLVPQDALRIQTDVFSDSDHLIAQRLAYAIDRSPKATKHLRVAADLLRAWDGNVASTSAAAAITTAAREALWPMLLTPQLAPTHKAVNPTRASSQTAAISTETPAQTAVISTETPAQTAAISAETPAQTAAISTETPAQTAAISAETPAQTAAISTETPAQTAVISTEGGAQRRRSGGIPSLTKPLSTTLPRTLATWLASAPSQPQPPDIAHLYTWGERNFALEQIIAHTPARWLPSAYATWDDLLTAAVARGLVDAHAPSNLAKWSSGKANPVQIQLPLFAQLPILSGLAGLPTGSGTHPQSGNGLTVRQSRRAFGPSERFSADLANPDAGTLVLPLGQSGNPLSPSFRDQFPAWLDTSTFPLPFTANTGSEILTLLPH